MKQEDIDRWEAEARANGVTLDAEMMEKWERYERDYGRELDFAEMKEWEHDEARSRIEDEALNMMYDYFSRKYDVKTYNHVSKEYESGIALVEKAMEYAKTWDGMSPGARFGKSLMNKLKRRM